MAADGRPVPAFATRAVLAVAGVGAVLHCAAMAFSTGYRFDEVYMLAIGRYHLDWGSADQPPLTPLLAELAAGVAPGSLIALRLPAVLATGLAPITKFQVVLLCLMLLAATFVLTGQCTPWETLWPRLRTLTVS
jgi:hypothetical protein